MYFIYKITNKINNKIYIGKTKHIGNRWARHKNDMCKTNFPINKAMRKYGKENFIIEKLACSEFEKEIFKAEKCYIKIYDSNNRKYGYNLSLGGEGPTGFKHSKEAVDKIILAKTGENNPAFKNKKSNLPVGISIKDNKYQASIYYNKKTKYLGLFDTIEQALKFQNEAKLKIINKEKIKISGKVRKNGWPKGIGKRNDKYYALIYINGKTKYLGSYLTIEEASNAYIDAVKLYRK